MNMAFSLSLKHLQSSKRQEIHEMQQGDPRQTDGRRKDIWGLADISLISLLIRTKNPIYRIETSSWSGGAGIWSWRMNRSRKVQMGRNALYPESKL